ncbi:hypothetical protein FRB91_002388 [Serendipita sp. 411]|nr:hypothetical protein FRB91_002388 [Serendipita sp. 411]
MPKFKRGEKFQSDEERAEEARFSEKRANLLIQIHDLRVGSVTPNDIKCRISRMKEENNRMVDDHMKTMTTIRYGHRVDPRSRLPIELFTEIIAYSTSDPLGWFGWCVDKLLSLTLVSNQWRDAILSTPHLWKDIILNEKTEDLQRKLSVALYLSGVTPIELHIHCSLPVWEEVEALILPHRTRINSLTMRMSFMNPRNTSIFPVILQHLGHLPQLRSFQCDLWYSEENAVTGVNSFLLEHPHIKAVSGVLLTKEILSSPVRDGLRSCRTTLEPQTILKELEMAPNLEEVTFMADHFSLQSRDQYHTEPDVIHLPKAPLKWKNYSQFGKVSPNILDSLSTTVTTLSLHICMCDFWSLCSMLGNFSAMESFEMTLKIGGEHKFTSPPVSSPSPCKTVRRLTLRFETEPSWALPNPLEYSRDWSFTYSDIIHQMFESIDTLTLSSHYDLPVQWHLIDEDGFQKLEKLTVSVSQQNSKLTESLQLPSTLESIYVYGDDVDLSNLSSKSVEKLNIATFGVSKSPTNKIDLMAWPNIDHLSLPAYKLKLDWPHSQFHKLDSVHLTDISSITWDYSTQFCRDLALYPDAMPHLWSLSLSRSPEWDILFILLERYNFRTSIDSERISCLSIGDAPLDILEPLQSLCAGKFTERPSNYELSWVGNTDIIFDHSLPGCLRCHKLLLFCRHTTLPAGHSLYDRAYAALTQFDIWEAENNSIGISRMFGEEPDEDLDMYVPKYPDNTQDILLEWEYRERAWEELHQLGRLKSCRGAGRNRVFITDKLFSRS